MGVPEAMTCSACGGALEGPVPSGADATREPQLKKQLLRGRLSTVRCPHCRRDLQLENDFLFQDHALAVQQCGDADAFRRSDAAAAIAREKATTRVVTTRRELAEKVLVADSGLDDRVVECLKLVLRSQRPEYAEGALGFVGRQEGVLVFMHFAPGELPARVGVEESVCAGLGAQLERAGLLPRPDGVRWGRVDASSAAEMLRRLAGAPG